MAERSTTIILIEQGFTLDGARLLALESLHVPLIRCATLAEALAQMPTVQPRAILLCALPATDLPEQLSTALAANQSAPRAIWLARRAQTRDALRALRLGFCDYRTNADTPEELALAVRRALEQVPTVERESTTDHEVLVSLVSHELRNPLMTINGYLELLKKYHGRLPEEKMTDFLDRSLVAMDEVTYLADLLGQIMHLEAGHSLPTPERLSLAEVVDECLDQCTRLTTMHTLHSEVARDLFVRAEPMALRQVVRNLVINAIKYSPNGGAIMLFAAPRGDGQVMLGVRDEGIGIAPDQMSRLFKRFARVHDVARWPTIRGTGLGLYLCRHLVEAMGGRIWAESAPGAGSVFAFTLPRAIHPARLVTASRRPARSAS